LEVKLGNNPELSGEVATQLNRYVQAITRNIKDFVDCYETNYQQKYLLGLFPSTGWPAAIRIDGAVEARVVVGSYSGIGRQQVKRLLKTHPELDGFIDCFWHIYEDRK